MEGNRIQCYNCNGFGHIAKHCNAQRKSNFSSQKSHSSSDRQKNYGERKGNFSPQYKPSNSPVTTQGGTNSNSNPEPNVIYNVEHVPGGQNPSLKLIDIGLNLTNFRFKPDRKELVQRAISVGVDRMILTGTNVPESIESFELAKTMPGVFYSTAGVHPHEAKSLNNDSIPKLRELLKNKEVVAVGETGLDFFRMLSPKEVQGIKFFFFAISSEKSFEEHIKLAIETKKPMFLHERDSSKSFIEIMSKYRKDLTNAVVHCFTGNKKEVEQYVAMDLHIGFTGTITMEDRGRELREILKSKIIPLNRLMIETDAPFMTPHNMPKRVNRNEPAFLRYVLQTVAECYGESLEKVAEETTKTTVKFFNL